MNYVSVFLLDQSGDILHQDSKINSIQYISTFLEKKSDEAIVENRRVDLAFATGKIPIFTISAL